jgi:hypothetical protein
MTNKDLLKEAIADAKTVKATAIANAKAALEETFAPHLKEMFSEKLREMENNEDPTAEEVYEMEHESRHPSMQDNELDLEALLNELDEEAYMDEEAYIDEEEIYEAKESKEKAHTSEKEKKAHTSEKEKKAHSSKKESKEDKEISLEDMSENELKELKEFVEEVIHEMVESGEIEIGHESSEKEMTGKEMPNEETPDETMAGEEMSEELDFEALLNEINKESEMDEYGEMEEYTEMEEKLKPFSKKVKDYSPNSKNAIFHKGKDEYVTDQTEEDDEPYSGKKARDISFYENELEETYNVIKHLRSELNEINLLNAKLLYTNKIFKAKNLTEAQKIKILSNFDKASTVKEAKLVYETLNEGLKEKKTSPITESKNFASKSINVMKNQNQPILEVDLIKSRFQKLAGII